MRHSRSSRPPLPPGVYLCHMSCNMALETFWSAHALLHRDAAEGRLLGLELELVAREAAIKQQLQLRLEAAETAVLKQRTALESTLTDADARARVAEAAVAEAKKEAELATKEVAEVKERARALMEEKDAQLQAARVRPDLRKPKMSIHTLSRVHSSSTEKQVGRLQTAASLSEPSTPLPISHGLGVGEPSFSAGLDGPLDRLPNLRPLRSAVPPTVRIL